MHIKHVIPIQLGGSKITAILSNYKNAYGVYMFMY